MCFKLENNEHFLDGISDPWEYRKKRSLMTETHWAVYEQQKVILLETLGNAGLDHSYHYIVSHINSSNSPWVKRAACHALRKYDHKHVNELIYHSIFGCVLSSVISAIFPFPPIERNPNFHICGRGGTLVELGIVKHYDTCITKVFNDHFL